MTELTFYLSTACAATYATLFVFIISQARLESNRILAFCCLTTSAWSIVTVVWPQPLMSGAVGASDMARMLSWYLYLLHLYRRTDIAPAWHIRSFVAVAVMSIALGAVALVFDRETVHYSLFAAPIAFRLVLAVFELLLIENLYLNLPEHARWHVALPCILLGGISCLDILISADAVLFHRPSIPIASARVVIMLIIAPLLVLAAMRGQRWNEPVRLSKTAVFHSATLVLSGCVLLSLGILGEALRYVDNELGWIAELSLLTAGLLSLVILLSSRSARSLLQRVIVHHFFADRFDYRVQWLQCIATLSGAESNESTTLPTRAVRAIADVVDSPSGSLFLLEAGAGVVGWAGSWNMPAGPMLSATIPVISALIADEQVVELNALDAKSLGWDDSGQGPSGWLAVPLLHGSGLIGFVIVGPPRTRFRLDQEVFDLLRILGREVATHIVEQRATETLHQARELRDYGQRFAFVAHDIKNVSSQLALLLQNAEYHLANPEFQLDMVQTVRSSVRKIDSLLKRLDHPNVQRAPASLIPAPRLEALVMTYRRIRQANVEFQHDGSTGEVAISPSSFEMVITHLINNAVEAAPGQAVQVSIHHEIHEVVIRIRDHGPGMSQGFIRDHLFKPFETNKQDGSGIGAYQARELLREAGGQLTVLSELGIGTTMQIALTRADRLDRIVPAEAHFSLAGGRLG